MRLKNPRAPKFGWSSPDPTPLRLTVPGDKAQPSLRDTVERVLRDAIAKRTLARKFKIEESLEEMNDFDVDGEGSDAFTRFELAADALPPAEFKKRLAEALVKKPSLGEYVRRTFGHLFGMGELKDPPPPAAPAPDPKQAPLPGTPVPEVKKPA